jgi:hypothetical protein
MVGQTGEHSSRFLGLQREEGEFRTSVDVGNHTSRESTESTLGVIQEHRARERLRHRSIVQLRPSVPCAAMARFAGRALGLLVILVAAFSAGPLGAAPSSVLSISVSGVSAGPFSATLRWQASRPASVVVEYGLTDDYGIWSRRVVSGSDRQGQSVMAVLEPGREYRFRVLARSGASRTTVTGALTTQAMPLWVGAVVTPRALAVAGQPFFPRMVWQQCPWAYPQSLDAGINLYVGTGCGSVAAQGAALQGRALSILSLDHRGQEIPGTIGFHQLDEADEHVTNAAELPLLPSSETTHRATFLTLTNHFFSGAASLPPGRTIYPALIARAEMIGFDLYPLQIWCRRDTLHAVYEAQRELVALASGKPTYQWIEAGPMSRCPWLSPSPSIVRAETWLAIAGGARGVGWFPDYWSQPIADEIGRLSREIVSLAPALLAEDGAATVTPANTPVRVGVRTYNGATYVIAVNSWIEPTTARIEVPGLRAATVHVLGENAVLKVRGGVIADSFRGLRVKIYVAPPPGT